MSQSPSAGIKLYYVVCALTIHISRYPKLINLLIILSIKWLIKSIKGHEIMKNGQNFPELKVTSFVVVVVVIFSFNNPKPKCIHNYITII